MVTGKPGCGKSSLARAIAYELKLGRVLHWPITSRSTIQEGLYSYDAVGRLQETHLQTRNILGILGRAPDIGKFVRLGPLGTALLPTRRPRVLLIDEIDKSDLDLPNDLLYVLEHGTYEIPELTRISDNRPKVDVLTDDGLKATIHGGKVTCCEFPFVLMTSNQEKEFPPPFLRRCIRMTIPQPDDKMLAEIVKRQIGQDAPDAQSELIDMFLDKRDREKRELATDQLLNAMHIVAGGINLTKGHKNLREALLKSLSDD
jgi:MoxR-like ATPase